MTFGGELKPTCPECETPVRDIEAVHIDAQRALGSSGQFTHQLVLFCGHKVEVTVEQGFVSLRSIPKP